MKRVTLLTTHYFESKRKANFHWLAEAFWRAGWEVVFFTTSISWLSYLGQRNHRLAYPILKEARKMKPVRERLHSYVWFTPWHPARFPTQMLNDITHALFAYYGKLSLGPVEPFLRQSDLFIFDAGAALQLFDRLKALAPNARFVYRASDLVISDWNHPSVMQADERYAAQFDVISAVGEHIYSHFAHLPNAALHPHGIDKAIFDQACKNPYQTNSPNLIYTGISHFDYDFLERASHMFPEWNFHIIGPIPNLPQRPNIYAYGEMPFVDTVPYLKYADIGMNHRTYAHRIDYLASSSLKLQLFSYCRLPIVAPEFMKVPRNNLFYYTMGDEESIRKALLQAYQFDRSTISTDNIRSWDDFVELLGEKI